MTDAKIKRINELAKKERETGLTEEEKAERQRLREEYIAAFRSSLKSQLDNMYVVDKDGNEKKIEPKGKKMKH